MRTSIWFYTTRILANCFIIIYYCDQTVWFIIIIPQDINRQTNKIRYIDAKKDCYIWIADWQNWTGILHVLVTLCDCIMWLYCVYGNWCHFLNIHKNSTFICNVIKDINDMSINGQRGLTLVRVDFSWKQVEPKCSQRRCFNSVTFMQ